MSIFSTLAKSLLGLTLVAAATSSQALSLASILHLHSHLAVSSGERARLRLLNPNDIFRDVEVDGQVYTIRPRGGILITAPVGTPVYAASKLFRTHAKGSLIAQVESGNRTVSVD